MSSGVRVARRGDRGALKQRAATGQRTHLTFAVDEPSGLLEASEAGRVELGLEAEVDGAVGRREEIVAGGFLALAVTSNASTGPSRGWSSWPSSTSDAMGAARCVPAVSARRPERSDRLSRRG